MSENNSFTFYCLWDRSPFMRYRFRFSFQVIHLQKKKNITYPEAEFGLIFIILQPHRAKLCSQSHQYKSKWICRLQKTSSWFIPAWLTARCACLPPTAMALLVIASRWDLISLHSSVHLAFQVLRSLLNKEINICFQAIPSFGTRARLLIPLSQLHLKWLQACTCEPNLR